MINFVTHSSTRGRSFTDLDKLVEFSRKKREREREMRERFIIPPLILPLTYSYPSISHAHPVDSESVAGSTCSRECEQVYDTISIKVCHPHSSNDRGEIPVIKCKV